MIVQSFGAVQALVDPRPTWSSSPTGTLSLYGLSRTYGQIYQTQPNVRTCVDFIARNVAQLGLHVFRRISDTDRERLIDHQLARWLGHPNPATTRYRHFETLLQDLGVYLNAYWLKVRRPGEIGLVRLPAESMTVEGGLLPTLFVWTSPIGERKTFAPSEIVHFGGFDPCNPLMGLSPLETLRRTLAEEMAAGEHRENYWRNASRHDGVIEVAADAGAGKWQQPQWQQWREQWQERHTGAGAGQIAVLPPGATFKAASFSAKDSEYLSARKLTREECASAYHIPLPMVGILEHATFANIKEQHKHLYQDCLGPWLVMIEEEVERQLLIECDDQRDIYTEFNIAEKMKGSFEEQAAALTSLVGRPIMTLNEGRSRVNLPSIKTPEADQVAPQQGGPAQAPSAPDGGGTSYAPGTGAAVDVGPVLQATWDRQRARLDKIPPADRGAAFDVALERWNRELAADLAPLCGDRSAAIAAAVNEDTRRLLAAGAAAFSPDREAAYV